MIMAIRKPASREGRVSETLHKERGRSSLERARRRPFEHSRVPGGVDGLLSWIPTPAPTPRPTARGIPCFCYHHLRLATRAYPSFAVLSPERAKVRYFHAVLAAIRIFASVADHHQITPCTRRDRKSYNSPNSFRVAFLSFSVVPSIIDNRRFRVSRRFPLFSPSKASIAVICHSN